MVCKEIFTVHSSNFERTNVTERNGARKKVMGGWQGTGIRYATKSRVGKLHHSPSFPSSSQNECLLLCLYDLVNPQTWYLYCFTFMLTPIPAPLQSKLWFLFSFIFDSLLRTLNTQSLLGLRLHPCYTWFFSSRGENLHRLPTRIPRCVDGTALTIAPKQPPHSESRQLPVSALSWKAHQKPHLSWSPQTCVSSLPWRAHVFGSPCFHSSIILTWKNPCRLAWQRQVKLRLVPQSPPACLNISLSQGNRMNNGSWYNQLWVKAVKLCVMQYNWS